MKLATRERRLTGSRTALAAALLATACGSTTTSSAPTTTQTFSGTLTSGGASLQLVTVAKDGEIDLTLTSLVPQTTITVGLGLGVPQNGTCGLLDDIENAKIASVLSDEVTAGTYCILIYDVGNIQGSDTYTLTVAHS